MRCALLGLQVVLSACASAPVVRAQERATPAEQPVQAQPGPAQPPADPQVIEAKARTDFLALEPAFEVQQAITLDDPKRLKAGLTLKVQGMTRLEREYEAVMKLGSREWTVAALVRLGMVYDDVARSFREVLAPPSLTSEQLALFRTELENRAAPYEAKARLLFRKAISLEGDALPASDWVRYAHDRLAQQRP